MDVVGVRVEMPSNQPVVILRQTGTTRCLPIWIGSTEAAAIAFAQDGVVPDRPLTHDLIKDLLGAFGEELTEVHITHLEDNVFYASLQFASGAEVSARPSDAIAIALRTGSPLLAEDRLLDEAGFDWEEPTEDETPDSDDEVARFREFLDQVSPEDFGSGS